LSRPHRRWLSRLPCCGGGASCSRRDLLPFRPERLSEVAPLRQWSHDRAMHLWKVLVDRATCASWPAFTHQESACVAASRCGDIPGRCNGRVRPSMSRGRAMLEESTACALIARRPASELLR
jgi:hypothetical protein